MFFIQILIIDIIYGSYLRNIIVVKNIFRGSPTHLKIFDLFFMLTNDHEQCNYL